MLLVALCFISQQLSISMSGLFIEKGLPTALCGHIPQVWSYVSMLTPDQDSTGISGACFPFVMACLCQDSIPLVRYHINNGLLERLMKHNFSAMLRAWAVALLITLSAPLINFVIPRIPLSLCRALNQVLKV